MKQKARAGDAAREEPLAASGAPAPAPGVAAWLVGQLAGELGVDPGQIDTRERFNDLGLDSARAVGLLAKLSARVGRPIPPTLIWRHPTIASLARHLEGGAEAEEAPRAAIERGPAGAGAAANEPIAIVGIGCRFPGGGCDPERYFRLVREGVDAIREVGGDRWDVDQYYDPDPHAPGKMNSRWGGFLEQVDGFDPLFFGISPREAMHIDPQQRLMLELSCEALDDAGLSPSALRGGRTGVFFGAIVTDYATLQHKAAPETIGPYTATGYVNSIIANRVSYCLGLQGPSMAVDTACSSSLVAVHLACQSLRLGESSLALCGGVNLVLAPETTLAVSRLGALSPDGRCKAFDASANGYVRGEGGGVLALKTLGRALADGDRIYAIIRGSAVNNDGASNGLTAPNPAAQEALLREAYAQSGVDPRAVHYVEAHGTGTLLGDPIEAHALGAVLGANRPEGRPLRVGSVKTNIGHLEAAAGVAGLIKAALSLYHREVLPSLHFNNPNPHVPFAQLGLRVCTAVEPWPVRGAEPPAAGVSSFGFGGTNAHVVVEGAACAPGPLDAPDEAWRRRAQAPRKPETPGAHGRRLAFVCSGHGSQWLGMGRELLFNEPVFRAKFVECERALAGLAPWSLTQELLAGPAQSRLGHDRCDVLHPVLFSLNVALASLWRSRGVEPDAVVGHSIGEVSAAHIAGILELPAAMRVIYHTGRLYRHYHGTGSMAYVEAPAAKVRRALEAHEGRLWVAASNSPDSFVVSGDDRALAAFLQKMQECGAPCRMIAESPAHSPLIEPMQRDLLNCLGDLSPAPARAPMLSTNTGEWVSGPELSAAYWAANVRRPVNFAPAVERLSREGFSCFLELSPHPVLGRAVQQNLKRAGAGGVVLASLRRSDERRSLLDALGRLRELGRPEARPRSAQIFLLSAHTEAALFDLGRAALARLEEGPGVNIDDLCYTAAVRREHHEHRLATVGATKEAIAEGLRTFLREGVASGDVSYGVARKDRPPRVAFVFPGQGSQWLGMGRQLAEQEPAFRKALAECDEAVRREAGLSVLAELYATPGRSGLDQIDVIQPCLFAIQVALARLWRSWGVEPACVVGQSMGEVAAACVAGALDLGAAARVVGARSRLVREHAAGKGALAVAEVTAERAERLLSGYGDRLTVGAVNGPSSIVLSGEVDAVEESLAALQAEGIFCRRVKDGYASHGPQMQPLLGPLLEALGDLRPRAAALPFYSTVTGALLEGECLDAGYWARNLRRPVQLWPALRRLAEEGPTVFLELSPHPSLAAPVEEGLRHLGLDRGAAPSAWVGSLRRKEDDRACLLGALGKLYALGVSVDWSRLDPSPRRVVTMPTYPWQRTRHWLPEGERPAASAPPTNGHAAPARQAAAAARPGVRERLNESPREAHRDIVVPHLRAQIAAVLAVSPEQVTEGRPLRELGLDSLAAVELRNRIDATLGVRLSLGNLWQFSTPRALADHLLQALGSGAPGEAEGPGPQQEATRIEGAAARGPALRAFNRSPAARVRLFCFPYAGAGAGAFEGWGRNLPAKIEAWAYQPPGRQERLGVPAPESLDELLDEAVEHMRPLLSDRPFVLYGHSFGATVAYELCCRLRKLALPMPRHLFVGAAPAPHLPRQRLSRLDEDAVVGFLHGLEGTAAALLQDAEMRASLLKTWRQDVTLLDKHEHRHEAPLPCPITAFAGEYDPLVEPAAMSEWRRHTTAGWRRHVLPAGHFFLHGHLTELLAAAVLKRGALPPARARGMPRSSAGRA